MSVAMIIIEHELILSICASLLVDISEYVWLKL